MSTLILTLCIICQLFMIAGQLMLKRAMSPAIGTANRSPRIMLFAFGVACLTAWFFLWLGVLQNTPLSKAFPFEGLNPALMAIGAALILKERMTTKTWVGVGMICGGIVLVAVS